MQKIDGQLVFSPTDLNVFFESPFASFMDRLALERPGEATPAVRDRCAELIAEAGDAHEQRFLASLRSGGEDLCEIERGKDAFRESEQAIRAGRRVIYQAALQHDGFAGYADFLFRVDRPSPKLPWTYRIADTKLARKPKPYFLLQLCAYAEMLEPLLGHRPSELEVITGDSARTTFPTDEFHFYYLDVKRAFLEAQQRFDPAARPMPESSADHRHWADLADEILEEVDHPCRVAGITRQQVRRLANAGITTFRQLAKTREKRVARMAQRTFLRLRGQARIQLASDGKAPPAYELLSEEERGKNLGLALLPPPSPLDVFFDMEGYPLIDGGLEYLFGATYEERGKRIFKDFWAHRPDEERHAFEAFVDWAYARRRQDPSMHIYHYASYEVTALKRLMGRYGSREHEVDELLRGEVFVDLYRIVRQSMRVGEPSYSLKNIERLYRPAREGAVATAGDSVVEFARWLEAPDGPTWERSQILTGIRDYNRDDCDSTCELAAWLRDRQREAKVSYEPPIR